MPRFGEAHKLLSPTHPDTSPPAAGADPADGQVATWSAALKAWIAADPTGDGVTVHEDLLGLDADDHPHYALADKSRPDPWVAAADLAARSLADLGTKGHGLLDGLLLDHHTQYALLSGRSGGQSLIGGLAASEHLTLQSTAHATRGYVRAQDDLQLLSDILRDAAGTNRLQLAAASPHLTLTGDAKITGSLGVAGAVPSVYSSINLQPIPTPELNMWMGLQSMATIDIPLGSTTGYIKGLNFSCGIGRGNGGAILPILTAIDARIATMNYTGAVTLAQGLLVGEPFLFIGTPSITTWEAIAADACNRSQIVDAYGVHIGDITANVGFTRLLELGPATPYLRVIGGADPAANVSNVSMKLGATLKLLSEGAVDSGGTGYRCLRVLN